MPLRFYVCETHDVPNEGFKSFDVDGLAFPIVLAWFDDELFATSGICPHEDISFDGGSLVGEHLICPGHGYSFSLKTGECSHDASIRLSPYRVEQEHSKIYVILSNF